METKTDKYRQLLSIRSGHLLELADSKQTKDTPSKRESHLFKEIGPDNKLLAHYRVWTQQSSQPPFRQQNGWEKYSPDGELLVREVRYSRLQEEDTVTLH